MEATLRTDRIRDRARAEIIGGRPDVAYGDQRPDHPGKRRALEKCPAGNRSMPESWLEVAAGQSRSVLRRRRVAGGDAAGRGHDSVRWRNCQLDTLRGFVWRLLPGFLETPARAANRVGRTV